MKSRSGCLRGVLLLPIDVYAVMMILMLLAQGLIGERWNLVSLYNTLAHLFWGFGLLLVPFALLLRSRRSLVLLLPTILAFAITFGDHFLPHPTLTPDRATLKVVSFNMYDDGRAPDELVTLIKEMDADVIAMQELGVGTADAFDGQLADLYPYRAFHPSERSYQGMGLMSKYPITEDRQWSYDDIAFDNYQQRVELDIEGESLVVYNLHPVAPNSMGEFYNADRRNRGISALLKETEIETRPFLMVGDFNMSELSEQYAQIVHEHDFIDVYRLRGWGMGLTFTHGLSVPLLRLDYIFMTPGIDVADISVWPASAGSDHQPVVAEIVLP
jgi:endonuclease/exonuclease/phosphatase (EEP) superfamily protein YafD